MKKPEILAPAGNILCLKAAILAGCDAVYLGGQIFGARAFSNNFTNEEMIEAIRFAHGYGVKIYVTVNTLIYEVEIKAFMNYIEFLYKNNVDAVIVQDIGMMDLIRQTYPDLDVHASTQMHIHNIEGVKLVEKLGLTRVVLARETSIDIIKEIKKNTSIELEIFVHGALCISYSGQCLMSSLIGGRSGNRGTCAGSCRQKYDVLDSNEKKMNTYDYNLSTKDLNSLENIGKLIDIGVDSLKIEGRMKSPSYVYLVTKLYRKAVDSYIEKGKVEIDKEDLKRLTKTFNRKFTKGFLFNEKNSEIINPYRPNHLGVEIGNVIKVDRNKVTIKLSDNLNINDGIRFLGNEDNGMIVTNILIDCKKVKSAIKDDIVVLNVDKDVQVNSIVVKTTDYLLNKEIETLIENSIRKVIISGKIIIKQNAKMILKVTDSINKVEFQSENNVEKALNNSTSKEDVKKQLFKTGSTIFKFENIEIDMEDNLFIPIRDLNELRRKTLDHLLEARLNNNKKYKKEKYNRTVDEYQPEKVKSIYVQTIDQYEIIKNKGFSKIYVDNDLYENLKEDKHIIIKLPRVIEKYKNYDNHLLVGELGSVNLYEDIDTDFSFNVVNSYSIALLNSLGVKRVTVSYELNDYQLEKMISSYRERYKTIPNLAIIVYAKEEMMISKFNLLDYYDIKKLGYLKDRFNNLYKINVKDNLMYIYNYKPRKETNIDKYYDMGISEIRYNIIDEKDLNNI